MFRLKEFQGRNFGYWDRWAVGMEREIVVVCGPNGAGKTTFLDAILCLLGSRFTLSKNDLKHHLRPQGLRALLRGVLTNLHDPARGRRPFQVETCIQDTVTVACVLEPNPSTGNVDRHFFLGDGNIPIEKIQASYQTRGREESPVGRWLKVEEYHRALSAGGLPQSLLRNLAVEAKQVSRFESAKPRDIFQLVQDKLLEQEVLTNYDQAFKALAQAEAQWNLGQETLRKQQALLKELEAKVDRLTRFRELQGRVTAAEKRLAASQFMGIFLRWKHLDRLLKERGSEFTSNQDQLQGAQARVARLLKQAEDVRPRIPGLKAALEAADQALVEGQGEQAGANYRLEELAKKQASLANLPTGDLEAARAQAEQLLLSASESYAQLKDLEKAVARLEAEAGELEAGRPVLPKAVHDLHAALRAEGIPFETLFELVDVSPASLQREWEGALGDARYCLIVGAKQAKRALDLARKTEFPGPIYDGATLAKNETVSGLVIRKGAPDWLRKMASSVSVEAGAWRDSSGAWVRRAENPVLGKAGLKTRLAETQKQLATTRATQRTAAEAYKQAGQAREAAERLVAGLGLRAQLESEVAGLQEAKKAAEKTVARVAVLTRSQKSASDSWREQQTLLEGVDTKLGVETANVKGLEEKSARLLTQIEEDRKEATTLEAKVREQEPHLDALLVLDAKNGLLPDEGTAQRARDAARTELAKFGEPPGAEVEEDHRAQNEAVRNLIAGLDDRRKRREEAQESASKARLQYMRAVQSVLEGYKHRLVRLAEMAGIEPVVTLPSFTANTTDQEIQDAGIEVRVGYNGKPATLMGDSAFSRGEGYLNGLIVLMALAEEGQEGFFLMDEPLAHLSADRVEVLFGFMKATGYQCIICVPTNLDLRTYAQAHQVVVVQKALPGQKVAPAMAVAAR